MKKTIFVLSLLCATAAFGQSAAVLNSLPQPMQMADHPQHASEHPMATEQTLFGSSPYTFAKGEVPLADLGSPIYRTPLGDVAREARKEHSAVRKAAKVLED